MIDLSQIKERKENKRVLFLINKKIINKEPQREQYIKKFSYNLKCAIRVR